MCRARFGIPVVDLRRTFCCYLLLSPLSELDRGAKNKKDRRAGSRFIYSWLHLAGYDLPLEEVKNFRVKDSKTPGHPESPRAFAFPTICRVYPMRFDDIMEC